METLHQKLEIIGHRYLFLDILGQGGMSITDAALKADNARRFFSRASQPVSP